jgi:predicted enzyme related to lactoylglutathione lyase
MPTIVHFEIPADDIDRAKKFYSDLFGWKIEKVPGTNTNDNNNSQLTSAATGEPIEYWMITTTNDNGSKALSGGLMKRQMPEHRITNYIGVDSIDKYSSKVEEAGGKVVAHKHAVPRMGYFALCLDTENNPFAIWETNESSK